MAEEMNEAGGPTYIERNRRRNAALLKRLEVVDEGAPGAADETAVMLALPQERAADASKEPDMRARTAQARAWIRAQPGEVLERLALVLVALGGIGAAALTAGIGIVVGAKVMVGVGLGVVGVLSAWRVWQWIMGGDGK